MNISHSYISPNWPAPVGVRAYTSLRTGGYSLPPYAHFNLSDRTGDSLDAVTKNRDKLKTDLGLTQEPIWIEQIHGTTVICADTQQMESSPKADAIYSSCVGTPCLVLAADCLPLLLCHRRGLQVAAIHAGWRGLADGVIEATFDVLEPSREDWLVWLGPAMGASMFFVGEEVRERFLHPFPEDSAGFKQVASDKWLLDIYYLARQRLSRCGIKDVFGGEYCTYSDRERFYSYRREGSKTGRMVSLIWREKKCQKNSN